MEFLILIAIGFAGVLLIALTVFLISLKPVLFGGIILIDIASIIVGTFIVDMFDLGYGIEEYVRKKKLKAEEEREWKKL